MYLSKEACAQAHHICAYWGVDESTYAHISVREEGRGFWIKPHHLLFSEVSADDLILIGLDGCLKDSDVGDNITGASIHSGIYRAREDVGAVIHLHTPATVAVSADPRGLRMASQWALQFYNNVAFHKYDSLSLSTHHGDQMAMDLGEKRVLLMAHHGFVAVGADVAEALYNVHHFEHACRAQTQMNEAALNNELAPEICERSAQDLLSFEKHLGRRDFEAYVRLLCLQENTEIVD